MHILFFFTLLLYMLPGMVNAQLTCEDPLLFTNTQTLVCSGQVTFAQVVPPLEAIEYFWALDGTDIGSTIEPQIAIQWTSHLDCMNSVLQHFAVRVLCHLLPVL
ncbi:MAG: hypothetical protein IPJ06_14240 [Saprospiraceae bacterium]|nr:hypothetical protein [Saprospiraceae bacterium]